MRGAENARAENSGVENVAPECTAGKHSCAVRDSAFPVVYALMSRKTLCQSVR